MSDDVSADRPAPAHIAIIMDGNGRWARRRGQPRAFGHRKGVETVRRIVEGTGDLGVKHLTLFSFSTENWRRPADEIGALFELMKHYIAADLDGLARRGVKIRILGSREGLREDVSDMIRRAEAVVQVSWEAGDYQIDGAERVATLNIGGSTATTACFVVQSVPTV